MKTIILMALMLLSSCSVSSKKELGAEMAIQIATKALSPPSDWEYTVSVRRTRGGEWLVLFEGNSNYVGDFVYVYLSSDGKVRKIQGGM
jgi:hypothetical protein